MLQELEKILNLISSWIWGWPLIALLFGTHIFLTFRLGFIQRFIGKAIKLSFSKDQEGNGDITHFGALATALAATVGTGNIVGVATAISLGGPGAVLWMWLTGVFGIATKYAEAVLSVKYRQVNKYGEICGGPMYVIEKGLKQKWLAILFALFTAIAAFGIGNMVQANSISVLIKETFNISPWISGGIITLITALVILGGIKKISGLCEKLVPFMVLFYTLGCLIILAINYRSLGNTIYLIISSAFTGQAAMAGFIGSSLQQAMRYGIARGLFSNESGLGSAPIVAAAAKTSSPVRQALVSSTGTFWDTVVVCLLTGLVIVSSGSWLKGLNGAMLTKDSFSLIAFVGPVILTIGLLTFVFSTIIGWCYYGEKAVEYLLGIKAIKPYRWLWVGAVMLGSVTTLNIVWAFADIANAFMALPNLISLLFLSKVVIEETKLYLFSRKPEPIEAKVDDKPQEEYEEEKVGVE